MLLFFSAKAKCAADDDNNDKEITYPHEEPQSLKNLDWDMVPSFIRNMCWDPMNRYECRQTCYYKEKLPSIRRQMTNDNLILRPVYKGTRYHLGSIHRFQEKVSQCMAQTNSYSLVFKLSRSYSGASQNRLANTVERVATTSDHLLRSKSITEAQYITTKINTLVVGIPVRPIMVCNGGPTMGISHFLGRLLGSLSENVIRVMTFYEKSGQLQPNTLFTLFNIDDLCLMFSHQQVINVVERFLNYYVLPDDHIQGMTIDTILQLVRLVLDQQYFV